MPFANRTLNDPVIKGLGKCALGVGLCALVYSLDSAGAISNNDVGKIAKYGLYTGGVIAAVRGLNAFATGGL